MSKLIPPPHSGETILEDIVKRLGMSVNQLAKALGITAARLNDIVRGRSRDHGRYGATAGTVSRNLSRILAWPPTRIRPA
jgi:transcriptional regulator with XRE-family HTH domain